MGDPMDSITITCDDHHEKLVGGLWNFFLSRHGVDFDVKGSEPPFRAHRLLLELFLIPEKLVEQQFDNGSVDFLLEFLYKGQVTVPKRHLDDLTNLAKNSEFEMLLNALAPVAADEGKYELENESEFYKPNVKKEMEAGKPVEDAQFTATDFSMDTSDESADLTSPESNGDAKPLYECSLCEMRFLHRCILKLHLTRHSDAKPYTCTECQEAFHSSKSLEFHRIEHSTNICLLGCSLCGNLFRSVTLLRKHERVQHNVKRFPYDEAFNCDVCQLTFPTPKTLKRHQQTHTKFKVFKRKIDVAIPDVQPQPQQQQKHQKHQRSDDHFVCDNCRSMYPELNPMQLDQLVHRKAIYTCGKCVQSFTTLASLSDHQVSSCAEKFVCAKCERSFTTYRYLQRHLQTICRQFRCCEVCRHLSFDSSSPDTHTRMAVTDRPYQCKQCPKGFITNRALITHGKIYHPIQKTLKCDLCPESFATERFFKLHMLTHGIEPSQIVRRGDAPAVRTDTTLTTPSGFSPLPGPPQTRIKLEPETAAELETSEKQLSVGQYLPDNPDLKSGIFDACGAPSDEPNSGEVDEMNHFPLEVLINHESHEEEVGEGGGDPLWRLLVNKIKVEPE